MPTHNKKIDEEELVRISPLKTVKECCSHFGVCRDTINYWKKKLSLKFAKPKKDKMTNKAKENLSNKRKEWLKANPDKHPWRKPNKFKSVPCEKVKEFLKTLEVQFIAEFQPEIKGRFFSVDIALPDKMIALEVNGNQHYERDGKLKPYYQERHDLLVSAGWNVFEIHYSACFKLDQWVNFAKQIAESPSKTKFDYFNYTPKNKRKNGMS